MKSKILIFLCLVFIVGCTSEPKTENPQPKTSSNNDYYENGNIRIERKRLDNGDSLWIFKQEDGGCWEENFYRDGEIYKKIVYNTDCTKSAEYELKDGKRNGEWTNYHENGKIWVSGIYKEGIPDGEMRLFDSTGKIIQINYHFQKDTMKNNIFRCVNELNSIKSTLANNKIKFIESDDIKVAGDNEYHFPTLKWNNSELNFDYKDHKEQVQCVSGKLTIKEMDLLMDFTIDMKTMDLFLKLTKNNYRYKNAVIHLYDLKNKMTYKYHFENKSIASFSFEGTNLAY